MIRKYCSTLTPCLFSCLYLNIYVPSENPILNQSSFVVYFWIYGGVHLTRNLDAQFAP